MRSGTCLCLDGDSSEYFCSIVRFTIQTGNTLPVFIPSVSVGQDNPNKTIYTLSLTYTYKGVNYISTNNVIYVPEDKTAPIPAPPLLQQDFSSKYYYVYNYSHFVGLVNSAFHANLRRRSQSSASGRRKPIVCNSRSRFRF